MSDDTRLYFSGDTGYFAGFKEARHRLGPFDLAATAMGAYLPPKIMKSVHTTPEAAVQAFIDLEARVLVGIHWGRSIWPRSRSMSRRCACSPKSAGAASIPHKPGFSSWLKRGAGEG